MDITSFGPFREFQTRIRSLVQVVLFFLAAEPLWSTPTFCVSVPTDGIENPYNPGQERSSGTAPYGSFALNDGSGGAARRKKPHDYYVSPNGNDKTGNGSKERPWATINHADTMIGPRAIVHVMPGTYNNAVSLRRSGAATARITYISDVKWGAKLVVTGKEDSCFNAAGSYVDYIGFDITEDPITGSCRIGMLVTGGHTTVQQNRIHDLNRDSRIRGCSQKEGGGGIVISSQNTGPPLTDTALVDSNLVDNIGGQGDFVALHTCPYIANFYLSMSNLTATNNISLRAGGFGFSMGGHPPSHPVSNQRLGNNTAIKDGRGAFYLVNDVAGTIDYAYNNIVDERWSAGVMGFATALTVGTAVMSNNLVYMPIGGRAYSLCRTCTVSNSYSGNPLFVKYTGDATGDYHLQPWSPAIGRGTALNAPAIDFDGNPPC